MFRNPFKSKRTQQHARTLPWEIIDLIFIHCVESHSEWELWFGLGHASAALRAKVESWVLGAGRAATLPGRNNDSLQQRACLTSRLDALFNVDPASPSAALRYTAHVFAVPPVAPLPPKLDKHEKYGGADMSYVGVPMRLSDESSCGIEGLGAVPGPLALAAPRISRANDGGGGGGQEPNKEAHKCLVEYQPLACSHGAMPSYFRSAIREFIGYVEVPRWYWSSAHRQHNTKMEQRNLYTEWQMALLTEKCGVCDAIRLKPAELSREGAETAILAWEKRGQAERGASLRRLTWRHKRKAQGRHPWKRGTDYWQFYLYSSSHSESQAVDQRLDVKWKPLDAKHVAYDDADSEMPKVVVQFDWREIWVKNMANARAVSMEKELYSLERVHVIRHCISVLHGS